MQKALFEADPLPAHCRSKVAALDAQAFAKQAAKPPAKQIARARDPATSKQAASEAGEKLGRCQAGFIGALKLLGMATAAEAAQAAHAADPSSNAESYRKRARECVERGLAEWAGQRRCRITGKMATVYRAKP